MATTRTIKLPQIQRLFGVDYDTYVRLRDERRNRGLRLTYVDGVLEIMSPEYLHELGAERLGLIVRCVADAFEIRYTGARCTTFRRGRMAMARGHGKEPDQSFYLAHEPAIRGKNELDLDVDPPPDLWIEVDNRGSSRGRLPLYARLGVPEVWQYRVRRQTLAFFQLDEARDGYEKIGRSACLPMLTPELILSALERAEDQSEYDWSRWLRCWASQLPQP